MGLGPCSRVLRAAGTCKHLAQAEAGDISSCVFPAPIRYLAQSSSRCHGRGTFIIRDICTGQPRLRLAKEPAQGHTAVSGEARLEPDPHMACILSTLLPRFPDCLRNVPPCRIRPGPSDSGHAVNLGGFRAVGLEQPSWGGRLGLWKLDHLDREVPMTAGDSHCWAWRDGPRLPPAAPRTSAWVWRIPGVQR